MQTDPLNTTQPNWRQVATFVGVTFGLTYLLDLVLYLTIGYGPSTGTAMLFQVQMLIPASVAIALQLWAFKGSPLYHLKERTRWFFYFFLAYAVLYAILAGTLILVSNALYETIVSLFALAVSIGGLVFVVILRLVSGREPFEQAGLAGGKLRYYLAFGVLLAVIYGAMTALNALFGLGQPVDPRALLQAAGDQSAGLEALPSYAILLISGVQSILLAPFLGLLIAFGEEYGWRGYLQGELIKLGKVRGILLVGVIWGLWHAPAIMMGHNYPGYPLFGVLLMTLYTIALAFFLGFVVLKSGSVWLAAYLHAINNALASFLIMLVYAPNDPVFSFGVGLYGMLVWAIVVAGLLVLGRREWFTPDEGSGAPSDRATTPEVL